MSPPLDTIIIGAGTAGLAALREVRKRTERFLIVNEGPWGTTCARVGCMPSKALIEVADAFHRRHALAAFGVQGTEGLRADVPAVLRHVRALRDHFAASALQATAQLGRSKRAGRATVLGPQRVDIDGRAYDTRSIVIATGSRPHLPDEWLAFGERMLTTDNLFEQPDLGPRVAVIGMGPIGVEIAQALARLGLTVWAFSTSAQFAGLTDPAINAELTAALKADLHLHVGPAAELREVPGGIEVRSGSHTAIVDHVVAAIGRVPNIEHLGLETLGVPLNDKGLPHVDAHTMQVGDLPVFMAGDANTQVPLLHEAADEGHIAGMNALQPAQPRRFDRRVPLSIVFSAPQTAVVGQGLAQLDAAAIVTGKASFEDQGRARAAGRNRGQLHLYADGNTGQLRGAELCAPGGEHLAHLLALALTQKMTVHDMLGMPFYHPTLEEGLRTALRDAAGQLKQERPSDLSDCPAIGVPALE